MSPKEPDDVLKVLTKIETLDDFEENKKIIVDLVIDKLRVGVDALKSLTDGSRSPEEIETKITRIEGGREKLDQEMEKELGRISKIPGAEDVVLSLRDEMMGQMGPLAQEMAQVMAQLMGNMMGGMMGEGMGDEMSQMIGELDFNDEDSENYELPEGEAIEALDFVRSLKSTDDMGEKDEEVINLIVEMYKKELKTAQDLINADLSTEDIKEKVIELKKRQMYIISKMEKEFTRLDANPGSSDLGDALEEELTARIEPIMTEFFEIIEELGNTYMAGKAEAETVEERKEIYCPECEHLIDEDETKKCSYCGLYFEEWYEGRERIDILRSFYETRSLDDLKEYRDGMIEQLESALQDDLWELEALDSPEWINDSQEKVGEIEKRLNLLSKELETELTRLKAMPDAAKDAESFQQELMEKVELKTNEMKTHLERIKKEASWHNG